jgi:hypothetical protein
MSLLGPLYLLAGLAIGLPILFHLIRRQPRGELPFSSLMFLEPSPPRLNRKSRIEHWILLALRGLAIALLAFAFSRPFIRTYQSTTADFPGRLTMILVDVSASMMREDLIRQAQDVVRELLDHADPQDQFLLAEFDHEVRLLAAPSLDGSVPADSVTAVANRIQELKGTWSTTDLGVALVDGAEHLMDLHEKLAKDRNHSLQMVVITDMQEGANQERLQGYQWPEKLRVSFRPVKSKGRTNASLAVLESSPDGLPEGESATAEAQDLRVRVHNATNGEKSNFEVGFLSSQGKLIQATLKSVHVPPGGSQVVRLRSDEQVHGLQRIGLQGDDHDFDNLAIVQILEPRQRQLLFIGNDVDDPRQSLLYYLRKISLSTNWQTVTVEHKAELPSSTLDPQVTPLIVLGTPPTDMGRLKPFISQGGRVIAIVDGQIEQHRAWETGIAQLLGDHSIRITESKVKDYGMLGAIDFKHPLFAPFADPKFSDFTKIRFWSHREVKVPPETCQIPARFEQGLPAICEWTIGGGKFWLLAAGWQPNESQWALSTKFVPLVSGFFDPKGGRPEFQPTVVVGQELDIAAGTSIEWESPLGEKRSQITEGDRWTIREPGVYRLRRGEQQWTLVANLPTAEGKTGVVSQDVFEAAGVPLGLAPNQVQLASAERQMKDVELERRQSLWKWFLLGALGLLGIESILGGWWSREKVAK